MWWLSNENFGVRCGEARRHSHCLFVDAFAELDLPRSPTIDEEALERRFDELGRRHHPDTGGDADAFARLGEARRILASPALRLRHLLELTHPGTPLAGPLSPWLMDLFGSIGPALQSARHFSRTKQEATTALTRALLAPDEMRHRESLEAIAASLAKHLENLVDLSRDWDGAGPSLAAWAREAAFLEKWQAQVRDALAGL